jgi:hypothetical protein
MRKMILLLLVLTLIAGVVYVAVFERDRVMGLFDQGAQQAKQTIHEARGFTPARTPEEALQKFREAIKARDYEAAASYLNSEYAEQMRRAAPAARSLATAIDAVEGGITSPDLKSDQVVCMLRLLEPFPAQIRWEAIQLEGEDRARTGVYESPRLPLTQPSHGKWQIDEQIPRALAVEWVMQPPSGRFPLELKREGQGETTAWKIHVPVTDRLRKSVDRLVEKYPGYVKNLDDVRRQLLDHKYARAVDLELAIKRATEGVQ